MNNRLSVAGWLVVITVSLLVLAMLAVAGSEIRKAYWDRKVSDMCSKEGGIKLFRTVELDADEHAKLLNRQGQIDLRPESRATPADKYVYSFTTESLVHNGLKVRKEMMRVLDRSGPVVLAEEISFSRIGGDLIPLDQHSSFGCPPSAESLFAKPFIKRQGEKK